MKCLLVDDREENLVAFEALLAGDGVEILKARSGREALEMLLVHDVGLAIIDVQMPEMDGFEVAKLMGGSERTRSVPIIFVTAGVREVSRIAEAYDAGAVDFLFKPIEPQILKHKAQTFFHLYRQRQELANTLRLNEELMAVVGHDLRNPLQAILMTASVLSRTSREPETIKATERLRSSGNRILRIIDELLDLSRARLAGGIPLQPRVTDLQLLAQKTAAELETSHPGRPVELRVSGNTSGVWDPDRLEQVLSNLVGNAQRHGEGAGHVLVALEGQDQQVTLRVENDGEIPDGEVARIFEPFRRGRGLQEGQSRNGLGLGLYIVQQIVIAHGGTIEVRSCDGRTAFLVCLPRERPGLAAASGEPSAHQTTFGAL